MTAGRIQRSDIQLADLPFWERPLDERAAAFRLLRETEPIAFFEEPPPPLPAFPQGRGFFALTRHADVVEASRRPGDFCSGEGTTIRDQPPFIRELFGSIVNLDDPRHARMRRIVSYGFTPRALDQLVGQVGRQAREIVDSIATRGEIDFVDEVAARFPLRVILDLMGIPRSEEDFILERSNIMAGSSDPEYVDQSDPMGIVTAVLTAANEVLELVGRIAAERRAHPAGDLISSLVNANIDGESLTPEELSSFFILLIAAGSETTRTALGHAVLLLSEHPDQRAALLSDIDALLPTAVEEIVRYSSPVIQFRRTVTRDGVELAGHTFNAGDKVVLYYPAANRDPAVFTDPDRFDVTRDPNPHIGYGGPGPHFCLGAHLARRELTVMLRELYTRLPDLRVIGEPDRLRSDFVNGIKHLPVAFTPERAS
jgi:methyl-branched lipid omega-hydroxylase